MSVVRLRKKNKMKALPFSLVIIVLAATACMPKVPAAVTAEPVGTPIPTAVPPTETEPLMNLKPYKNSTFGLSFAYPSTWSGPDEYVSGQTLRVAVGSGNVVPYGQAPEQSPAVENSYLVVVQFTIHAQDQPWKDSFSSLANLKDGEALSGLRSLVIRLGQRALGTFTGFEYISTLSETAQTEPVYTREVMLVDEQSNLLTIFGTPVDVRVAPGTDWREAYRALDEANQAAFHQIVDSLVVSAPAFASTEPVAQSPGAELQTADLSDFVSSWNSHDVAKIRSLYTEDARYFPEQEMVNLKLERPIDVLVSGKTFEERVRLLDGLTLRILGDPLQVYEKLVAFAYRWENDAEGHNGAALLRYEGDKILLHADLISSQASPNQPDASTYFADAQLNDLMQAWSRSDLQAAGQLYSEDAAILSDEDMLQVSWRDFPRPPGIEDLFAHFSGWEPRLWGKPLRIEDFVIFAWHWNVTEYPAGHGLRLLHYDGSKIVTDIRIAIRPWEAQGNTFNNP
jgi:ketosteroid isomerase-like protein